MKIKQRGSSSLSIIYCIHGNRLRFDIYTMAIDRNPAVQEKRSAEHPGRGGACGVAPTEQPGCWGHPAPCPRSHSFNVYGTAEVQPICRKKN